jgi:hypothetical protein
VPTYVPQPRARAATKNAITSYAITTSPTNVCASNRGKVIHIFKMTRFKKCRKVFDLTAHRNDQGLDPLPLKIRVVDERRLEAVDRPADVGDDVSVTVDTHAFYKKNMPPPPAI